jgi:hypothetical protein
VVGTSQVLTLGHFVEQSARAGGVARVRRERVRNEERVPGHDVADGHGVEGGTRCADVAAACERREERVPGDHGAGRERIEEAPSGVRRG